MRTQGHTASTEQLGRDQTVTVTWTAVKESPLMFDTSSSFMGKLFTLSSDL